MSDDLLREAAALMRERVTAVREAAVEPDQWFGADELAESFDFSGVGDMGDTRADTDFIASWHPDVALAVALLFENEANAMDARPDRYNNARAELLADIARAYLGRES